MSSGGTGASVTAFITARGGSKGLPGKNVRPLRGRPLIAYSIEAALGCPSVSRVFVTTDDAAIKAVSLEYGALVIDRPAELATDTASSAAAVVHALRSLERAGDPVDATFVLLQPTSPLRTARHVSEALALFERRTLGSVVSVCETAHHPLKSLLLGSAGWTPLRDWEALESPRQRLPRACRANGAIYICDTHRFLAEQRFFIEPMVPYFMTDQDSLDIDTEEQLLEAERLLARAAGSPR